MRLQAQVIPDSANEVFCISQVEVEVDLLIPQPAFGDEKGFFPRRDGCLGNEHAAVRLLYLKEDELPQAFLLAANLGMLGFGLAHLGSCLGEIQVLAHGKPCLHAA